VNERCDAHTDRMISQLPYQTRNSPYLRWLGPSDHEMPDLIRDLTHYVLSDTDVSCDGARTCLQDSSWITQGRGTWNDAYFRDQERAPYKQQGIPIAGSPVLLPPYKPAGAVSHNDDAAASEGVNDNVPRRPSSGCSMSSEKRFEKNESFINLESPCWPLAKQMSTRPTMPVSVPCKPSSSRLAKVTSTPYQNKVEDNSSFYRRHRWMIRIKRALDFLPTELSTNRKIRKAGDSVRV